MKTKPNKIGRKILAGLLAGFLLSQDIAWAVSFDFSCIINRPQLYLSYASSLGNSGNSGDTSLNFKKKGDQASAEENFDRHEHEKKFGHYSPYSGPTPEQVRASDGSASDEDLVKMAGQSDRYTTYNELNELNQQKALSAQKTGLNMGDNGEQKIPLSHLPPMMYSESYDEALVKADEANPAVATIRVSYTGLEENMKIDEKPVLSDTGKLVQNALSPLQMLKDTYGIGQGSLTAGAGMDYAAPGETASSRKDYLYNVGRYDKNSGGQTSISSSDVADVLKKAIDRRLAAAPENTYLNKAKDSFNNGKISEASRYFHYYRQENNEDAPDIIRLDGNVNKIEELNNSITEEKYREALNGMKAGVNYIDWKIGMISAMENEYKEAGLAAKFVGGGKGVISIGEIPANNEKIVYYPRGIENKNSQTMNMSEAYRYMVSSEKTTSIPKDKLLSKTFEIITDKEKLENGEYYDVGKAVEIAPGLYTTAWHVAQRVGQTVYKMEGFSLSELEVISIDKNSDVAILKAKNNSDAKPKIKSLDFIPIISIARDYEVGEGGKEVFTIGDKTDRLLFHGIKDILGKNPKDVNSIIGLASNMVIIGKIEAFDSPSGEKGVIISGESTGLSSQDAARKRYLDTYPEKFDMISKSIEDLVPLIQQTLEQKGKKISEKDILREVSLIYGDAVNGKKWDELSQEEKKRLLIKRISDTGIYSDQNVLTLFSRPGHSGGGIYIMKNGMPLMAGLVSQGIPYDYYMPAEEFISNKDNHPFRSPVYTYNFVPNQLKGIDFRLSSPWNDVKQDPSKFSAIITQTITTAPKPHYLRLLLNNE